METNMRTFLASYGNVLLVNEKILISSFMQYSVFNHLRSSGQRPNQEITFKLQSEWLW